MEKLDDFLEDLQIIIKHHKPKYKVWTREDESREDHVNRNLQLAETQLDSLTQKLIRSIGKNNDWYKQARLAYMAIRELQFGHPEYYKVVNHSLLRYTDCKVNEDGSFDKPITKNNWRKYKREKERENLVKLS